MYKLEQVSDSDKQDRRPKTEQQRLQKKREGRGSFAIGLYD
jgi:hypothetical protein